MGGCVSVCKFFFLGGWVIISLSVCQEWGGGKGREPNVKDLCGASRHIVLSFFLNLEKQKEEKKKAAVFYSDL